MRIHSDILTYGDIVQAMKDSRTSNWFTVHSSRSRARAFEVKLTGESNRRPNGGTYGAANDYAATWDQWGVFLGVLYRLDPELKCRAYADARDFNFQTEYRFGGPGFPEDYHGDHTFRNHGTPYLVECTKCSATQRWYPRS